jgi:hypothetical protein
MEYVGTWRKLKADTKLWFGSLLPRYNFGFLDLVFEVNATER